MPQKKQKKTSLNSQTSTPNLYLNRYGILSKKVLEA
jgi:hypothetical protein